MNPIRPHGAWYLLAPAFLLAGIAVSVVLVATTAANYEDNRQRVPVPGETALSVESAGAQPVYFEESGTSQARVPGGLELAITPEGGGPTLSISPAGMRSTYHYGGTAGVKLGDVNFPAAGRYRARTSLPEGVHPPMDAVVVVGGSPVAGVLGAVFGSIGAIGVGFVLAVIAVVIVAVRRAGSRKAMMPQFAAPLHPRPMGPPPQQHGPRPAPPVPPDSRQ